ncbi:hypothetical protein [Kordia sp.]|uniref:hypothetical protein n=1 Tax=Kordia sp. TaxID=1965332 RepID=UPI003B59A008
MREINKHLFLNKISISSLLKIKAGNDEYMSVETNVNYLEPPRPSLNCASRTCSGNPICW